MQSNDLKRKFVDSDDDDEIVELKNKKLNSFQIIDWLEKFQPREVSDLVVHPKKLKELGDWFKTSCVNCPNKILLLEGPTGCAKTTALKLIAKENEYDICEWINSTDIENDLFYENSENFQRDYVSYANQVTKFKDFLLQTSRFPSLFSKNKRLILVKDLPNAFLKKTAEFWSILGQYADDGMAPLVFIITETNSKSLDIAFNLFPDQIRIGIKIDSINFNPITAKMMRIGIKRILELIKSISNNETFFTRPTDDVIDDLIEQSQGDIRNAVLNLNFASQPSNLKLVVSKVAKAKKSKVKTKSSGKSTQSNEGLGKNEILSLMHGLGRVLHPKWELNNSTKLIELTHKPEVITESFLTRPKNFVTLIHSNYIKSYSDIHSLSKAAEMLSISDCFESEYRDSQFNQLSLDLAIRAVMVLNKHPAPGFRTISAYANKKWKNAEETKRETFKNNSPSVNNGNMIGRNDFFCDYKSFMKQ